MVTLHIGVSWDLQDRLIHGGAAELDAFAGELGAEPAWQPELLAAFGILTCRAPASRIAAMRAVAGVEFVTPDKERRVAAPAA